MCQTHVPLSSRKVNYIDERSPAVCYGSRVIDSYQSTAANTTFHDNKQKKKQLKSQIENRQANPQQQK